MIFNQPKLTLTFSPLPSLSLSRSLSPSLEWGVGERTSGCEKAEVKMTSNSLILTPTFSLSLFLTLSENTSHCIRTLDGDR